MLALVITAAVTGTAVAAHGINFVYKDDTGGIFLSLLEHIAHPAGADADKHFDKIRAGNGKERHPGFASNGARQKGFTCARRAHQKRAFGDLPTKAAKLLRIAQKLDNLFKLFLGLINAGYIIKGHPALLFGQQFGARFAKAHGPAATAALHPVHKENPHPDQQKEREDCHQK